MSRSTIEEIIGHLGALAHTPDKIDREHVAAAMALAQEIYRETEADRRETLWDRDVRASMAGQRANYASDQMSSKDAASQAREDANALAAERAQQRRP